MFLEVLIIGILAAFLTVFLNYTIGKPGSDKFSPYEIFSFYTVWISKRRLKQVGLWDYYQDQYYDNEERVLSEAQRILLKKDYSKIYYDAAEPFFTWERAAGMCPICFGVWVAGIVSIFFTQDWLNLLIVILISHVIIRLLTKII